MNGRSIRVMPLAVGLALVAWACASGVSARARSLEEPARRSSAPAVKPRRPKATPIGPRNVAHLKLLWDSAVGGFGRAVAVSRPLGVVAVASGTTVVTYDLWSGHRKGSVASCRDVLRGGLRFREKDLIVACRGEVASIDVGSNERLSAPKIAASEATAVAFAAEWIALGHRDGVVRLYSLRDAKRIEVPVPGPPVDVKSLALTPDGARIAVAWVQGSVWWWDASSPSRHHDIVRHPHESDALAFSHDGGLLAEEGDTNETTVWAFGQSVSVQRVATVHNGDWIKSIAFTADDTWLIRGGSDGLELAEIRGPRRVALDTSAAVEDLALDAAGALIAAIDRKGRLSVWVPR